MRARRSRQSEENNYSDQASSEEDIKSKFKPELGQTLAYTSLFALGLTSVSGLWFLLLQSQPVFIYTGLTLFHLALAFSMGKSFLPCHYSVWFHASIIGVALSSGLLLFQLTTTFSSFGVYVVIMSLFHFGEFFVTALTNPANLSTDSFLLNHSKEYWLAAVASWIEFSLEAWLLPSMKSYIIITVFGVLVCAVGDFLRKLAMFHAGKSFSHIVQCSKQADHKLVTSGVYRYMRHPSYVGWFYWSVGTQIVLSNPVCFIIYAIVSWKFFSGRIYVEEYTLVNFFGDNYVNYQQRVGVGIPFIKGFNVED